MFKVGDKVGMPAFKDCFGHTTKSYTGFTVTSVRTIKGSIPDYQRVSATKDHNSSYIEGADRFFVKE